MNKNKKLFRGTACIFSALLAFSTFGRSIAEDYKDYIDAAFGTVSSKVVTDDDEATDTADLYTYTSQYKSTQELVEADKELGTKVGEEGSVLLKNEDNTLPLSSSANVSLLGNAAYDAQLGGAIGSAAADNSSLGYAPVQLVDALEEVGMSINPNLQSAFESWLPNTEQGPASGSYWLGMNFAPVEEAAAWESYEPTLDTLESNEENCTEDYGEYTDAAIVVLSRVNAEGSNMTPGNVNEDDFTLSDNKNPLSLSDKEKALIKNAKEHADKVIVLLNANNPLELSELNEAGGEYEADAILWIGTPGVWGMRGVANVLSGSASPSGKTVDTFAANSALSPAAVNSGVYLYANSDDVSIPDGTEYMGYTYENETGTAYSLRSVAYEVEAEGIYTGYKYYETRYYDTLVSDGLGDSEGASPSVGAGSSSWNYDDEVCYSFGYGLSYAEFTQTLRSLDVDYENQTVTAEVEVVRSEDDGYDGEAMDVVELYVQSPYTEYDVENKVEKAAIQLLDYEKTEALAPGESTTVTITTDMKYMASYDYTNAKTYILDDGEYYFAIGNGAHDALNNILAAQDVDGVSGDAALVDTWTNEMFDDTTFAVSENGTEITNQLDDADINYYQPGTVTYLSRSDWDGTWPVEYSEETGNQLSVTENMIDELRNRTYEVADDDTITTTWGDDNGLSLSALKNADFDDERWQYLLEEITIEEAIEIVERGGGTTETLESIQNPSAPQSDGPNGFNGSSIGQNTSTVVAYDGTVITIEEDDPNKGYNFGTMANAPVIAATFSKTIAKEIGVHYGEEALWCGNSIIWGTCGQLHRSAYGGRAHEYYSEDAMLTCFMNQKVIEGSREMGLINGPKHLAFNNTEYNRYGLSTFLNEQAARENELRGFQGGFEDGGALGVMGGYNRVGITYCNAHIGLMQNILRDEWGFKGILSTDMGDHIYMQSLAECVMAGTTMIANSADTYTADGKIWSYASASEIANDSELLENLQKNMKYQWYAYANSNLMNGTSENSHVEDVMTWWRILIIALIAASAVLLAAVLAGYTYTSFDRKKGGAGNAEK